MLNEILGFDEEYFAIVFSKFLSNILYKIEK